MPTVYVIIVTHNGAAWLSKCLGSLRTSTVPVVPVVVDNHSTDETVALLEAEHPDVTLIKSKMNLGFGKANNLGIEHALGNGADYLFLLNQDAWLYPDTLERLMAVHQRHPEFMILSPLHLEGKATGLDYLFARWISKGKSVLLATEQEVKSAFTKEVCEVAFINAAMWLMPKEAFAKIGAFDPLFFHYGEDDDYANRVRFHGYKIGFCPGSKGVHDRPQPSANSRLVIAQRKQKKIESSYLILLKNINHPFRVVLRKFGKKLSTTLWKHIKNRNAKELMATLNLGLSTAQKVPNVIRHRRLSKSGQRVFLAPQRMDLFGAPAGNKIKRRLSFQVWRTNLP